MSKTIEQLKAQGAEVKNATVVGENTATRVGTLFTDIVEHLEQYEAGQTANTEKNTSAINQEEQARAKADEQLNAAIEAEKNRAEAAEKAIIFDVSAHNNSAVFESLSALLSSSDLSKLIPTSVRHGGMSIRFIQGTEQSSDNKYVQARLMANTFTTNVTQWQKVVTNPSPESKDLVDSGGIESFVNYNISAEKLIKRPCQIQSTTWYNWENKSAWHYVIPVIPGITIDLNGQQLYYALLTDYTVPVEGETPFFVSGKEGRQFSNSTIAIPDTCKYLIINIGTSTLGTLTVNGYKITDGVMNYIHQLNKYLNTINFNSLISDNDLTTTVVSKNIANPDNIITDGAVDNVGSKPVAGSWSGWDSVMIPVSAGQIISFGGVYLGRSGYGAFYNGNTFISMISFADPNGGYTADTINITVPSGATELYIDIKTASSPANPYDNLMVNYGSALLPYEPFEERISKINDISLIGDSDTDAVDIIADLPVSDGTGISVGYAYIDSSTGNVKVKL